MGVETILAGVNAAGALGSMATGAARAFTPQKYPPGFQQALQGLYDSENYANWAADPTSEAAQNLAAGDKQLAWLDILEGIRNIQANNQRAQARGLGGIANARGREDENTYRTIAREFMRAGLRARTMSSDKLMRLAGAATGRAGGYNQLSRTGTLIDLFNRQNTNQGLAGIFTGIPALTKGVGSFFNNPLRITGNENPTGHTGEYSYGNAMIGGAPAANSYNRLVDRYYP